MDGIRKKSPFKAPAVQLKPAGAQSKPPQLKTPSAPPVYKPQSLPKVLQRKVHNSSPLQPAQRRPTFGVVQRSVGPVTRGNVTAVEEATETDREVGKLFAGNARVYAENWQNLTPQQRRDFILKIQNQLPESRSKRAPQKPGGPAALESFTFQGAEYRGLNPGGQYFSKVTISYTGSLDGDFSAADRELFRSGGTKPPDTVWHHYHDYDPGTNRGTMFLMNRQLHESLRHHGGMWMYHQSN